MSADHPRYRPRRRRRLTLVLTGVVLAVVLAAAGTVIVVRTSQADRCTGQLTVPVSVAPSIQPVVAQVAQRFNASDPVANGRCVQILVTQQNSAEEAADLPAADLEPPAMWIPDSSMWAQRVKAQANTQDAYAPTADVHGSLATSPIVLAAPKAFARQTGWPGSAPSWAAAIGGTLTTVIGSPTNTTEGLVTLVMAASTLGRPNTPPSPAVVGALLRLGKTAFTDVNDEIGKVTAPGATAAAFTASEQAVIAHNRQASQEDLVAMYPKEGTLAFDYPIVRVTSRTEPAGTAQAATAFEGVLRSADSAKQLADAGFRDPHGATPAGLREIDGARLGNVPVLPQPDNDVTTGVLRLWGAVNLDARFLNVVDVSSAMGSRTGNGETRAEVTRDAANLGLTYFPDTTEVGLWTFADQLSPPNDWKQLVSLGPLGETMDRQNRRAALLRADATLPGLVGGRTALYNTAWAAYQAVRTGYDPAKVNAVVLMTDGHNDATHGLDLPGLLSRLRAAQDPAHPMPLFAIGIGPDADMAALRQLAAATGGKAYQAVNADDITGVFLDVMAQRTHS